MELRPLEALLGRRQLARTWKKRLRIRSFLILGLFILITFILPPHVAARCFGVFDDLPETGATADWSLRIVVTTANGYTTSAALGFHPNATDGFDYAFDIWDPLFNFDLDPEHGLSELSLFAYFYYPENAEASRNQPGPVTVGLKKSVIEPSDNMSWPLRVAYFVAEGTEVTLGWDPEVVGELSEYEVELFTPTGEVLPMTNVSSYTFHAERGLYDFRIRALGEAPEASSEDSLLIAAVLAAYAAVIVLIFVMRRQGKRRRQH